ncbi:MAG: mechanosensitive ion channel domain-containing protein [Phycisphaerales bacterium JB040]
MPAWLSEIVSAEWFDRVLATAVLVCVLLVLRWMLMREIRRSSANETRRRSWMVQARNALLLGLLLGGLIIWGGRLQAFALSAVAIAAAIVLATKELIMCVSGSLLEGSAKAFKIGDRIEVGAVRGDVYDQTLLTTTVLEVGPGQLTHQHTGRMVTIPNSLFLSVPIVNETATDEYVMHVFVVPTSPEGDWSGLEKRLLEAAEESCARYLDVARGHFAEIARERGLRELSVEPRVTLRVPEAGKLDLVVRLPAPARTRGRIEQQILRKVLGNGERAPGS